MTTTAYPEARADNVQPQTLPTPEARWSRWRLAALALALALLQVGLAGYQLGVGNQTIQIPYLLHLIDPTLFAADPAIAGTIERYPSWCYRLLAPLCAWLGIAEVYVALHLLAGWALFAALLALAQSAWGTLWPGLIAGLLLLGGQQQGLSGGDTYVAGFTHTWLALAWALWAIHASWQRRWLAAGLLLGLLFDLHALMAGYATVLAAAGALAERRPGDLRLLAKTAGVAVLAAAPTLLPLLLQRSVIDPQWFALMYARSSHHSWPLALWSSGEPAIPRMALLLGFAAIAAGWLEPALRRRALGVMLGFALLLLLGLLGTGSATILKAQLWRSSALLVPLALLLLGHGCWAAWRAPGREARVLALGLGGAALVLALPVLAPLRWPLLIALSALLLALRRLSLPQALLLGPAHALALAGWLQLQLPLLGWPQRLGQAAAPMLALGAALLLVLLLLPLLWPRARALHWLDRPWLGLAGLLLLALLHLQRGSALPEDDWVGFQLAVRDATPPEAVILSPLERSGFRIHSQRSVVAEWRDGTQLYFAPDFAATWWQRVEAVQPGIRYSADGRERQAPGLRYALLDDAELVEVCAQLGASHVVLPTSRETRLLPTLEHGAWRLCRAELPPPPEPAPASDPDAARARFLAEVVEPSIQRHRRGRLEIELRDAAGRALKDLDWELELVEHAFGFGCSLGHFVEPPKRREKDYRPPVLTPEQLAWFPQIFNYSIVPYSAKWVALEPEPEQRFYADLDAYLAFCEQHAVEPEFHFVTGYPPDWMKDRPREEKQRHLMRHVDQLIDRYGQRFRYWQVVNEKIFLRESPEIFRRFRERLPAAKLGISDCARFYSDKPPGSDKRQKDLLRGMEEIRWLREQGIELDFFAVHAHRPFGLWAELEETWRTLDAFAAEGLRIHISEFGVHEDHEITGEHRHGRWNAELQAEYYELMFRVFYAHPAVDVVNLWGFSGETWMTGAGLLDRQGQPKPGFHRLKRLVTETWHSHERGSLPLTGRIAIDGFHGRYQLRLRLADGSSRTLELNHPAGERRYRVRLDPDGLRIEAQ